MDAAIKMGKSITCHGGALWLIFPHSDSRLCFFTESTDVGAIVHHSQVNYEAANWSCANILPIIADHHLGESRSGSDSWKRLWHSGELLSIHCATWFNISSPNRCSKSTKSRHSRRRTRFCTCWKFKMNFVIMKSRVKHLKRMKKAAERAVKQLPLSSSSDGAHLAQQQRHQKHQAQQEGPRS